MTSPLIKTVDLTKRFGHFRALDHCSLSVRPGEVFGLLGPNGAGKTTLIRLLLGFLRPTSGFATIAGLDCHRDQVAVHRRLSYLPGDARLFRLMSGRQVLKFFAEVRQDGGFSRAVQIAESLDLNLSRRVGFMSTGMRQKLALTVALSVDQPLLVLDEPTANLDPTVRRGVMALILEAKRAGRTVLFSSHVLSEIEEVCDRVAILRSGMLVHEQCMTHLKHRYRIILKSDQSSSAPLQTSNVPFVATSIHQDRIEVMSQENLHAVIKWAVENACEVSHVQPEGLRAVYEQFHSSPGEDEL